MGDFPKFGQIFVFIVANCKDIHTITFKASITIDWCWKTKILQLQTIKLC